MEMSVRDFAVSRRKITMKGIFNVYVQLSSLQIGASGRQNVSVRSSGRAGMSHVCRELNERVPLDTRPMHLIGFWQIGEVQDLKVGQEVVTRVKGRFERKSRQRLQAWTC